MPGIPTISPGSKTNPRYRFEFGDIADRPRVMNLVAEGKFDAIVNFAAESHVDRSISDATPFLRTNVRRDPVPAGRRPGRGCTTLCAGFDRRSLWLAIAG